MTAFLLKQPFHSAIAQNLADDVQLNKSSYYYFLGRTLPWGSSDAPPDSIGTSHEAEMEVRREIVAMERINSNDVSMMVARHNWQTGTVYAHWDSAVDMSNSNFFVINDDYNVYKCIDNAYGAPSTVKPTGNAVSMFRTVDGYLWKYMYTIPLIKRNKFESSSRIPVQRALSDSFYDNGAVNEVIITNGGSGYVDNLRVNLSVAGGSPTTAAVLVPVINEETGSIVDVFIQNPGAGYVSPPTITITSDDGSGSGLWNAEAQFKPIMNGGQIVRVSIEDPGQNYPTTGSTIIEVDGDGVGASFTPIISGGKIVAVSTNNRGTGYTYMNLDVIGTGTGATMIAYLGNSDILSDQSMVESTAIDGGIHLIKVVAGGQSYTTATVTVEGDGTGCVATPVIVNGSIVRVDISNPGTGYSYAEVIINGNNLINNPAATSASARAIISPIGGHGRDAPRELFSDTLCMYSVIRYSSAANTNISQDFRQYGLIRNPKKLYTGLSLTEKFGFTTFNVTLDSVSGLSKDMILINGTRQYRIIDFYNTHGVMLLPLTTVVLASGDMLETEDGLLTKTVTSISAVPLANKYSGEMMFISSDYSFAFNTNQSVTIKTYLKL